MNIFLFNVHILDLVLALAATILSFLIGWGASQRYFHLFSGILKALPVPIHAFVAGSFGLVTSGAFAVAFCIYLVHRGFVPASFNQVSNGADMSLWADLLGQFGLMLGHLGIAL